MDYLQVCTKGGGSPQGKPRVYFTCHPEDFRGAFDKICADIFKTHDCAVYYTGDMSGSIPEENRETDLGRMNLFVIPVSLRLLTQTNRAMDEDFPFAMEKHIPVLPILLETGLDGLYSREDRFGKLQYLDPITHDDTAIGYEEKLKKVLESVLVSDETAARIRAAFDAYIFLSYRKKDRQYANRLMELIHANPICRDIAIWYDEYLTPGEDFSDAIRKALEKSELFTLLVTPNLVNEDNYVQSVEYPAAREAGKAMLAAEMAATDQTALQNRFPGIPECVSAADENTFGERLTAEVSQWALRENDNDPAHNFLIGLAYLDGIDMEVNRERAVELITGAAEAGLPEAMEKLRDMYGSGTGVALNYPERQKWCRRLTERYMQEYGEEDLRTLAALHDASFAAYEMEEDEESLELLKKEYALRCRVQGKDHPDTLTALRGLAIVYREMGNYEEAQKIAEKIYAMQRRTFEEEPDDPDTLNSLANVYITMDDDQKAAELLERVYDLRRRTQGEEHPDTLAAMSNLSFIYSHMFRHPEAQALGEQVYALRCKVLGEEHPDTLTSLNNLAHAYSSGGEFEKALPLFLRLYEKRCRVYGLKAAPTRETLRRIANAYDWLDYPMIAHIFRTWSKRE